MADSIKAVCGGAINRIELLEGEGWNGGPDRVIQITLEGDVVLRLRDTQSCCERRYFHVDDDLTYYHGAKLLDVVLARWSEDERENSSHEAVFLDLHTSRGVLSICAHNEHNGWYGGFGIWAEDQQGVHYHITHDRKPVGHS